MRAPIMTPNRERREGICAAASSAESILATARCAMTDGLRAAGFICHSVACEMREVGGAPPPTDQELGNIARVAQQLLGTLYEQMDRGRPLDGAIMLETITTLLYFYARDADQAVGQDDPLRPFGGGAKVAEDIGSPESNRES